MKVVQLHEQTPKQFLNPSPTPKIARQGQKKRSKMTPKLSQNQMSESRVTQKNKVVQLHEQTQKQCLDPSPTPKNSPLGPKKVKLSLKLSRNKILGLKKTKKMKVVHLHNQTLKQFSNPTPTPKIKKGAQNQVKFKSQN